MVPPWALRSKSVDHRSAYIGDGADSSNLTVITVFRYWQVFNCYCTGSKLQSTADCCLCATHILDGWLSRAAQRFIYPWQPSGTDVPAPAVLLMLPVIIPQIKHASSLATAATAYSRSRKKNCKGIFRTQCKPAGPVESSLWGLNVEAGICRCNRRVSISHFTPAWNHQKKI